MKKHILTRLSTLAVLAGVLIPTAVSAQELNQTTTTGEVPFTVNVDETATQPDDGMGDGGGEDGSGGGTGDGETGETPGSGTGDEDTNIPIIESNYTVTIPSGLASKPNPTATPVETKLVDFAITAKDVILTENQAVQVDVQAKSEYQIDGKNVLLNEETGEHLGYSFKRIESANYGFDASFDDGDAAGAWTAAQFRPDGSSLFTNHVPIEIVTEDAIVTPGTYNSVLQFHIHVVDTIPVTN